MQPFRFKQFSVEHSASPMRVGTDGVTLGALAPVAARVLDVGCGCGLIGLMLAQRGACRVEMVDIDGAAAAEAALNAAASPWSDRVGVSCCDFLKFSAGEPFDLIVSNPPFFANGIEAPDSRRASARHDSALPPEAFMRCAAALLAPGGRLCVILPADCEGKWTAAAAFAGLSLREAIEIKTKPAAPAKRVVLTFAAEAAAAPVRRQLALNSPEYRELTDPFYL
ncbi:MAG: methyltransferase [Muribaculaceae bacterium]|nr:methyltransferase [Muribaculaceae bacterium]